MLISNEKLKQLVSVGFVCTLGAIGIATHQKIEMPDAFANALSGSFQTAYELDFVNANPLNQYAVSAMGALKYAIFGQSLPGAIVGKEGWFFTAEELDVDPNFYGNLSAATDEILRVETVLSARGVKMIPVLVPDKSEIMAEHLNLTRPVEIETRRAHLKSLLSLNGITPLDASDVLREKSSQADSFIKDDTHWSPSGSRAVADLIGAHVEEMGITLSSVEVTTVKGPKMELDGDLLQFIPTGALRGLIGPDQHHVATYTTTVQSSGGLFGDAQIDVALVGTSFSAKPEWNFLGFLQDSLSADVLNFATEGQGPFAPMQAFLASESYQNTPPKLVIWEIPVRYTSKDMIK